MIRKLAIALSLLGACFTGFVHALGLGEVTVKSALNQPLNAEIELVNTAGLSINEILPGLATREEFQKANVDRVYFLSDLRFEVITSSQGKAHIVLTSKKPVREPFLNFIVELIWPSGRLLREYALLIDPPLFSDQPIANVRSPSVATESTGDVLSISKSTSESNIRPILKPVSNIQSGTYGATSTNDTLWDIAIKARPDRSVSPQQVMLAIQDLNPEAFIDENINKLKAGHVLRLPSIEQIKKRSQHQAIIGVISQNEALSGKRTPSIVQGSESQSSNKSTGKTISSAPKVSSANDELKLVVADSNLSDSTNSASSGQSNQSGSVSSNELAVTLEKLDKASIENKELSSRLTDLEEQLSTLQRLLTLKNDQLASIQSQMRESEIEKLKAQEQTDSNNVISQDSTKLAIETEALTANDSQVEALETTEVVKTDVSVESIQDKSQPVINKESNQNQTNSANIDTTATEDDGDTAGGNQGQKSTQNIVETIINNPIYLAVSLIIILVLVVLLWMVSRYNAKREEEFQALNINEEDLNESDFDKQLEEYEGLSNEDFDRDDAETESEFESNAQDDEVVDEIEEETQDILAEVNAYISYGRLDQAAQVLEKSISSDPVRTDYRLKLLSIYKEIGDRQAFDRQFSELEAIQNHEAISAAEKIKDEMLEEESLSLDTDLGMDSDSDDSLDLDQNITENEDDLDEELKAFDFDSVSLDDDETSQEDLATELNLDDLDLSADDEILHEKESDAEVTDDDLSVEDVLSLDEDILDEQSDEALLESTDDFDDSILDVDLEDLDLNAELDQESEISLEDGLELGAQKDLTSEDELIVSDDILEEAAQAFEEQEVASNLDEDLSEADDFDFLNGTDEASTKLDLARAYIDMGDIDGAKDILLEVTKEGSEAQQSEAKDLLDSLN